MPPTTETLPRPDTATLLDWLTPLYGGRGAALIMDRASASAQQHGLPAGDAPPARPVDQGLAVLITYGDMVQAPGEAPLATLRRFLRERVPDVLSAVHVLPFYPYSSDDGFAVIDHRAVDRNLGDWPDVRALAAERELMFDLVLNHISRGSQWFANYLADVDPGRDYFIEVDPAMDLRAVVRPRSTPLLAEVPTARGTRYLWATFSEDQIDLDFANPAVLAEFVDIIFGYVAAGARLLRLDAVAFLWKRPGTPCIHLPETHRVIKFLRALLACYAPQVLLVTETNVPHRENISYLTDGDEAHLAYQFALPPLLLHTLLTGDGAALREWAASLPALPPGCHFFNFTASHDGIGLRAVENILDAGARDALVATVRERGGFVSTRAGNDGVHHPYELNIAYVSALAGDDGHAVTRFLCSQAVALALRGVPGVYFHSLVGTPNDQRGVEASGRYRSINRRRWDYAELASTLDGDGEPGRIFRGMCHLLDTRAAQPAFHPDAPQRIVDLGDHLFVVERQSLDGRQTLLAVHNLTDRDVRVSTSVLPEANRWWDLVAGRSMPATIREAVLAPYQVAWFSN